MKTIFNVSIEDDEVGEVEGMFSEDGTLLASWCLNDADWRNEYFDGFMAALGFSIKVSSDPKLEAALKAHYQG